MAARRALLAASVALSLRAAGALETEREGLDHEAFHSFMTRHGREYKHGSDEYHHRLDLFSRRAAEAEAHNAQPQKLWTAGINHLSDWTEEELAQLRGYRGVAAPGAGSRPQALRGGTFLSQRGRGRPLPQEFMNWTTLASAKRIYDQRACGSCWAVSSAAVLALHSEIHNPQSPRTFSPQELVSCVPNPHKCGGDGGCKGATVELAFNWAMERGLADEREVPYEGFDGTCRKQRASSVVEFGQSHDNELSIKELASAGVHSASAGAPGLAFGMHGWEKLPENEYEPLLRAVYEQGPVGVAVAASRWNSYMGGIFNGCEKDAVIDHGVVLKGYGRDQTLGQLFYLIQNSWGSDWGEKGHIRILRREDDGERCGIDHKPEVGTACENGPKQVKVCGSCGILYDTVVPHFRRI